MHRIGVPRGSALVTLLLIPAVLVFSATLAAPIIVLHERSKAMAILTSAAAVVNIAGDVVLIGPVHMGVSGAAVATTAALVIVFVGYLVIAARCTEARVRVPILTLLPMAAGVLPALTLSGALGLVVAVAVVPSCALAVQWWSGIISGQDLELIGSLDMPQALRLPVLRGLRALARTP